MRDIGLKAKFSDLGIAKNDTEQIGRAKKNTFFSLLIYGWRI